MRSAVRSVLTRYGRPRGAAGDVAEAGPSGPAFDRLAARVAIALRAGGTVASLVAAPLAATVDVSRGGLAAVLAVLAGWTALFVRLVLRYGLVAPVVVVDGLVVVGILLSHDQLVPGEVIAGRVSWVLVLASSAVIIPQFVLPARAGLPLALLVTAGYVLGTPGQTDASFLVLQACATWGLVTLMRRGGRAADAVIASEIRLRRETRVQAERRADEREQYRRLHDTVLSTLTMVGIGAYQEGSATLSAKAAQDLAFLTRLSVSSDPGRARATAALRPLLDRVAAEADLDVSVSVPDLTVPATVAERIADCAAEALRNTSRHAGVTTASVRAEARNDGVLVEVTDQGRGFDLSTVPEVRRGIRESIIGRMTAVGGSAEVISGAGAGTRVVLRWPDA